MRFILVKTADDRFPGWHHWRATCGDAGIDHWFWLPDWHPDGEPIDLAKRAVRDRYPDATFSDEPARVCH